MYIICQTFWCICLVSAESWRWQKFGGDSQTPFLPITKFPACSSIVDEKISNRPISALCIVDYLHFYFAVVPAFQCHCYICIKTILKPLPTFIKLHGWILIYFTLWISEIFILWILLNSKWSNPYITRSRFDTSPEGFFPREACGLTREALSWLGKCKVILRLPRAKTKLNQRLPRNPKTNPSTTSPESLHQTIPTSPEYQNQTMFTSPESSKPYILYIYRVTKPYLLSIKTKPYLHLPRNKTKPSLHLPSNKTKQSLHLLSNKTKPSLHLPRNKTKPYLHLPRNILHITYYISLFADLELFNFWLKTHNLLPIL